MHLVIRALGTRSRRFAPLPARLAPAAYSTGVTARPSGKSCAAACWMPIDTDG